MYRRSAGSAAFRPVPRLLRKKDIIEESCPYPSTTTPWQPEDRERPGQDITSRSTMVINSSNQAPLPGSSLSKVHLTKNHQWVYYSVGGNGSFQPHDFYQSSTFEHCTGGPGSNHEPQDGSPNITRIQLGSILLTWREFSKHHLGAQEMPGTWDYLAFSGNNLWTRTETLRRLQVL